MEDLTQSKMRHSTFTVFFTLGYYMGVIPYKPVFNNETGLWSLRSTRFQQVICLLLLWTTMWICHVSNAQLKLTSFVKTSSLSAKRYFLLIRSFVNDAKLAMFFWILLKKCREVEGILNGNRDTEQSLLLTEKGKSTRKKGMLLLSISSLTYITVNYVNFLFIHLDGDRVNMSLSSIFDKLVNDANHRFRLAAAQESARGNQSNASSESEIILRMYSNQELALGINEVIMRFANFQTFAVVELFFLAAVPAAIWLSMANFQECIHSVKPEMLGKRASRKERYPCTEFILDRFDDLKGFAWRVNEVWAIVTLIWLVDHSMRLIFLLNDAVSTDDPVNLVTMLVLVVFFSGALFVAAEVYRKVYLKI